MRHNPKPQEMYRHFKGNLYQIRCLARNSQTREMMVVYQAMYDTFEIYVRSLSMFMEEVDHVKYPEVKQKYCFELLQDMDDPADSYGLHSDEQRTDDYETHSGKQWSDDGETHSGKRRSDNYETYSGKQRSDSCETHSGERRPDSYETYSGKQCSDFYETHSGEETAFLNEAKIPATSAALQENTAEAEEQINIDPMVLEFLDANSYEQRLNILASLRNRITDEMINTMAVAVDLEIKEGDVEDRYEELRNCLLTFEKFECNRLR